MLQSNYHLLWAAFLIILSGGIFSTRFFSFIDKDIKETRMQNIDGLRYLLASFVALHHFIVGRNYTITGQWKVPDNIFDTFAGQFGVIIFFMISGSLFVTLCDQKTDWLKFYIKRFFRLVPMLSLSSVLCIGIAILLQVRSGHFVYNDNFLNWFDAAVLNQRPDLFGFIHSFTISGGVTWTLYWEWMLYFSLPVLFIINIKKESLSLMIAILFICYYIYSKYDYSTSLFISSFAFGGLVRTISNKLAFKPTLSLNVLTIIAFVASIIFGCYNTPYTLTALIIYALFFFMICVGGNFFGLLTSAGFRRLGDASFSIYLLHPIAWFMMNKILLRFDLFEKPMWVLVASTISWLFICCISIMSFHYIETYFISLGKNITEKMKSYTL